MSSDWIDAAGSLLGLADDIGGIGFKIAKLGYDLYRGGRSASAAREAPPPWVARLTENEAFIQHCIGRGHFDRAVSIIRDMNDVPEPVREHLVSRIREVERKHGPEIAERAGWNESLQRYLAQEDIEGALDFVRGLRIPEEEKARIIDGIRLNVRQRDERKAQAATWLQELNALLQQRQFRKARKYVEALPIPTEAKTQLLTQIPKPRWFW